MGAYSRSIVSGNRKLEETIGERCFKLDNKTIIAEGKGGVITYAQLVEALKKAGINQGDTICVHSDLTKFGKNKLPRTEYLQSYIDAFREVLGEEGILIMPTFSYSFCNGEEYNVQTTKSTVGVLTEYFRKCPEVVRTRDPIFSFAIHGREIEQYRDIGEACFSRDSMYGKLVDNKAKIIFLGGKRGCFTFNHFLESIMKVPYRFMKRFEGIVIDGDNKYQTYRDYYVRHLNQNSIQSVEIMSAFLEEKGIINTVEIGDATISCIECEAWYNAAVVQYKKNPYYFLQS